LAANISTQSIWDASEMHKGVKRGRGRCGQLGREIDSLSCGTRCTPWRTLTIQSFNVAFYKVARKIGPDKVVAMAHKRRDQDDMGCRPVQALLAGPGHPKGRSVFDYQVGFGQYPISVLDHATGMATIANHGVYNAPHFVLRVDRKNRQSGKWKRIAAGDERLQGKQVIDRKVADEVTYILKKVPPTQGHTLSNRQVASKSGHVGEREEAPQRQIGLPQHQRACLVRGIHRRDRGRPSGSAAVTTTTTADQGPEGRQHLRRRAARPDVGRLHERRHIRT
jgi:hypothetical protein